MQYTKKNLTLIDGKHQLHLEDATFFRREDGKVKFYKIDGTKVFVQEDVTDPATKEWASTKLEWKAMVMDPDEIIHSKEDEFIPLAMAEKPIDGIAGNIDAIPQPPKHPVEKSTEVGEGLIAYPYPERQMGTDDVHKENQTKVPVHLCPPAIVEGVAKTLEASTKIKGRGSWNWRKGQIDLMGYLGKTLRHIYKIIERTDKDDLDPETRTHHIECAAANLAIILDAKKHGTLADNRPTSIFSNTGS